MVNITANVDNKAANAENILTELKATVLTELKADYPGLSCDLEGEEKERKGSLGSMKSGFLMAFFPIFALLAIP